MKKIDKEKIIKGFKIILIIVWMITVFLFSNQQGEDSGNTSQKFTVTIIQIITGKSVDENAPIIDQIETIIRKLAHFTIYTVGGFLIMNYAYTARTDIMKTQNKEKNDTSELRKKIMYSIIFGAVYACTDELHQLFVPDRSARIFDVGIDTLGVITGVAIYLLIRRLIETIKKNKGQ